MNDKSKRDIEMHMQILAILTAAGSAFASLGILLSGMVLLPILFYLPVQDLSELRQLEKSLVGLGGLSFLFAALNLLLGVSIAYGLLKRRPWGRVLGIIDNTISLIFFPIGTLFGAYGLWVLLPDDAARYLHGRKEPRLS